MKFAPFEIEGVTFYHELHHPWYDRFRIAIEPGADVKDVVDNRASSDAYPWARLVCGRHSTSRC